SVPLPLPLPLSLPLSLPLAIPAPRLGARSCSSVEYGLTSSRSKGAFSISGFGSNASAHPTRRKRTIDVGWANAVSRIVTVIGNSLVIVGPRDHAGEIRGLAKRVRQPDQHAH